MSRVICRSSSATVTTARRSSEAVAIIPVPAGDSPEFLDGDRPDQNIAAKRLRWPVSGYACRHVAPIQQNNDTAISRFSWQPDCDRCALNPTCVQFRANDRAGDLISLVSLSGLSSASSAPLHQVHRGCRWQHHPYRPDSASACSNLVGYRIAPAVWCIRTTDPMPVRQMEFLPIPDIPTDSGATPIPVVCRQQRRRRTCDRYSVLPVAVFDDRSES